MNVLITGGAGYIGSVVTEDLVDQGHRVIVVDNLVRGNRAAVVPGAVFYQADIGDQDTLENIFQSHRVDAVLHLASLDLQSGAVEPAIESLESFVATHPRAAPAYPQLGAAYLRQGNAARTDLTQCDAAVLTGHVFVDACQHAQERGGARLGLT